MIQSSEYQYPDPLIDPKKKDKAFILQYGKAMYYSYRRSGFNLFYNARVEYKNLMRYAQGNQSINQYKKRLGTIDNQDQSWLNLDWQVLNLCTKYVNIVQDKLHKQAFDIEIEPIDALAEDQKRDFRAKSKAFSQLQKWLADAQVSISKDFGQQEQLPPFDLDTDEFEVYMQMSVKHRWAMQMEILLAQVLNDNDYEQLKKDLAWDLTVIGVGALKITERDNEIPKVEKVNPENLVVSNVKNEKFDDVVHVGEVIMMPANQFFKRAEESGCPLTEEEKQDILDNWARLLPYNDVDDGLVYQANNNFYNSTPMLEVMDFVFESINCIKYEKKKDKYGNERLDRKAPDYPSYGQAEYEKKFNGERKIVSANPATLYKGLWLVKSNYLIDYGTVKNINRDGQSYEPYFPYILMAPNMRQGQVQSLVKQMIPILNDIQLNWMKYQDAVAKSIPKGHAFDLDAMENINLGKGGRNFTKKEIIDMFYQRGSFVFRRKDMSNQGTSGLPIQELENGMSADVPAFFNNILAGINLLREIIGMNDLTDGSTPDPKMLKSVAEAAMAGSNSALGYLYFGNKAIFENLCRQLINSIPQGIKRGAIKPLDTALGVPTVTFFGENSEITAHRYGFKVSAQPTRDEWNDFYQQVNLALQEGKIDLSDSVFLREVTNLKQARQYLIVREKKKQQQEEQAQQASIEATAKAQQESNRIAEEEKRKTMAMELEHIRAKEEEKRKTAIVVEEARRETILLQTGMANKGKVEVADIQAQSDQSQTDQKVQADIYKIEKQAEKPVSEKK